MGYRLEISEVEYKACGGKLYGYVGNMQDELIELESYKWLLDKGYIDGDEYWDYGCNPRIVLSPEKFKEFIELYSKDWEKCYGEELFKLDKDDIDKIIDDGKYKLLEWY